MNQGEQESKEERVLHLIRSGNRLAFNQLYEMYWKELFHYAFKILSSKDLAEDVVQDIFLKIWLKKEELEIKKLRPYLFNAARNSSISLLREVQFTHIQQDIIESLSTPSTFESSLDYDDLRRNIDSAAEGLPERCKEIFYLSRVKNYSIDEIAERFNISRRTVENQISIALKHIRPQLTNVSYALLIGSQILIQS